MSEIEKFRAEVLEPVKVNGKPVFYEADGSPTLPQGRVSGIVDGIEVACLVPPSMLGDRAMCEAQLRHVRANLPASAV